MTDNTDQSTHSGDEPFRQGDVLSERYALINQLGSGASAITWRARDQRLERDVAIKILRRSYASDPTFAQRFDREARIAASVSHGNVVDIYDVGRDGETLYLVMQYVPGEDLKHLIQRGEALPPDRARQITLQVLAGLQAIHAAGIIHRDIKPQNVLIGRDGIARVSDFGVAQVLVDVGLTTVGTTVGTAAYMAPEQARAEVLSEATDLYSVGVMLYEMLTGRLPFTGATHMAMMLAHIEQTPVPPSQNGAASSAFDGVVLQSMAKSPNDRFRSAQAMARALTTLPLTDDQSTREVSTPTAQVTRQAASAGQSAGEWPRPTPAPSKDLDWARQNAARSRGGSSNAAGGVRTALIGFLVLIVLVLGAIGVYAYNEYIADDPTDDPTRTPTEEATREPTDAPTEESDDDEVPPIVPEDTEEPEVEPTDVPSTEEPEPTEEPTDEPVPTDEPTATDVPIVEPDATEATEDDQVILPDDPTETPSG